MTQPPYSPPPPDGPTPAWPIGDGQNLWARDPQAWLDTSDPNEGVGSRHHTVPAFYLRYFADKQQLLVRRIADDAPRLCNLNDLAQKDFYTAVTDDPAGGTTRHDARLEQLLQVVEGAAATAFGRLRNVVLAGRPIPTQQRAEIAQFLSFQLVRGVRVRREQELMAEYGARTMAQGHDVDGHRVTLEDLSRIRVVPHPNEHLRLLGSLAEQIFPHLFNRPVCVIELDRPLLYTADEPVLIISDEGEDRHRPECYETAQQRRQRRNAEIKRGASTTSELVHLRLTRPAGVATAEEVAMPLDPRRLLLLGAIGAQSSPHIRLTSDAAEQLAANVTGRLRQQAYQWMAAHPAHPTFPTDPPLEAGPLLTVCDGSTPLSRALRSAPSPRNPERLRRDWPCSRRAALLEP